MATSSKKEKAPQNSKYHPHRTCTGCILCGKTCLCYTHYGAWREDEKDFLKKHWGAEPESDSCICPAHQKEARRTHGEEFVPKWSKTFSMHKKQPQLCMYPSCHMDLKLITPAFAPTSEIQAALHVPSENTQPRVCQKHYQELYRQFYAKPCASCEIKPKQGTTFTRHCPNVGLINELLEGADISNTDCICLSCYKSHLAMVKAHDQANQLSDMMVVWESTLSHSTTDRLTKATLHSVLYVAHEFENERAVLLPHISTLFCRQYLGPKPENQECVLESQEGTIKFSSRWLLKQLIIHLHPHLNSKCIHKKFGVLLFKKGGDLLTSLSWALGTNKKNEEEIEVHKQAEKPKHANTLAEAGGILNDIIHSEIEKHTNSDLIRNMDTVNIDEQINKINPSLWVFIESITRTVRQREDNDKGENVFGKKLRRYYIFCLLLYCSNVQKPTVMHILLADTIEVCGGSRKLMKLLNQLGIVCSPDTHDRYVTEIAHNQRNKTLWDFLPQANFTVASVDNFDVLESHAAVYSGDQSRSYHGTTVQIVQPNPLPSDGESGIPKRTLVCSPASSPHQLGKIGPKRPRTVEPRSLANQLQVANCQSAVVSTRHGHVESSSATTIDGFLEQPVEKQERELLITKILMYMFIKQKLSTDLSNGVLHEFKDLYSYSTQGIINKSIIYYMELVDENPDSADTMRCVSDLLLHTAVSKYQDDYVVLVGDGKTYQHLMQIKQTYGSLLTKLLIFPGDWHILKNLQPVLLKIYYHAGLKELAQVSGFKGETLTSLEKCSNFKRTHQFLLQAWQAIFRSIVIAFEMQANQLPDIMLDEDTTIRNILKCTESVTELQGEFKARKCYRFVSSHIIADGIDMDVHIVFTGAKCNPYISSWMIRTETCL